MITRPPRSTRTALPFPHRTPCRSHAPHGPATAAPRNAHMFDDTPYPRPASFDEADVSDKPSIIRDLPRLDAGQVAWIEDMYRSRLRALQALDRKSTRLNSSH